MTFYAIGEFARKLGVTQRALRHYEKFHLLQPNLSPGGKRLYNDTHAARLEQVLKLIHCKFTLREIGEMLSPSGEGVTSQRLRKQRAELELRRAAIDASLAAVDQMERRINRIDHQLGLIFADPPAE